MRRAGSCGYAHSLVDLMPPCELERCYGGVWVDGVDRWYGQQVQVQQRIRILCYIELAQSWDVPAWARAFRWFYHREDIDLLPELGWDFGIWQDCEIMVRCRVSARRPFEWAHLEGGEKLWDVLRRRRDIFQQQYEARMLFLRITQVE